MKNKLKCLKSIRDLVFLATVIFSLSSCGEFDSTVGTRTNIFDETQDKVPNLFISNYQVTSYDRGILKWVLKSDFAELFEKKERTYLTTIDFKNYNELGQEISSAVAKYATLENDTSNIVLEKDVVIVNSSKTIIQGKYFYWNDKIKRFTSPYYVKIIKKDGSILSGIGFSANQELGDIEFKSKVSGQIGDDQENDFFQGFD